MGLWSFSLAMFAVVLVLTVPLTSDVHRPGSGLGALRAWFLEPWAAGDDDRADPEAPDADTAAGDERRELLSAADGRS